MKRVIAIALALLLLTGCSPTPTGENTVTFYYPRKNLVYSFSDLPIGAEARDCADEALEYVLRLYLLGPTDENLESLSPSGIRLLTVTLSPAGNQMQEIDFSLAGACLAKTCIGYGGYSSVTIQSGDRELTLKNDDLLFRDNSATLDSSKEEKEP